MSRRLGFLKRERFWNFPDILEIDETTPVVPIWGQLWLMGPLNCFLILKQASQKCLHTALVSTETAWPAFGPTDFFSVPIRSEHGWQSLWFGCFYLSECGTQGTALKEGEGGDVGCRTEASTAKAQKQKKHLWCDEKPANHIKDRK